MVRGNTAAAAAKAEESTPSKARSRPSITYEIVVPDLKPPGSYVKFLSALEHDLT